MANAKRVVIWTAGFFALYLLFSAIPTHLHRAEFDHAYFVWRQNPTPATEAAMREEQRLASRDKRMLDAILAALIVGAGVLAEEFGRRRNAKRLESADRRTV